MINAQHLNIIEYNRITRQQTCNYLPLSLYTFITLDKSEKPKICMYLMLWYLLYVVVLFEIKYYFSLKIRLLINFTESLFEYY